VLKIFSYAFTSYSRLIIVLHQCTAAHKKWILENWCIARRTFYALRRNRFYHFWTTEGRGAIRLKRNDWREIKELNLQR